VTAPKPREPERFGRTELENELHRLLTVASLAELTSVMVALGELEIDRVRDARGRRIVVDLDELPELIASSVRAVLATHEYAVAHDPVLPDPAEMPVALRRCALPAPKRLTIAETHQLLGELGRNVAGVIAVMSVRLEQLGRIEFVCPVCGDTSLDEFDRTHGFCAKCQRDTGKAPRAGGSR
jgi:hypothetical protein